MNRIVSRLGAFAVALSALTVAATTATPAHAQSKSKPTTSAAAKKKTAKKSVRLSNGQSAAAQRARAYQKLKDYNYVKSMSPYAGSPNKWGPKW